MLRRQRSNWNARLVAGIHVLREAGGGIRLAFVPPPFFERLLYYILIPDLVSRIVFEFVLGIYFYNLTQPKQWMFYALLGLS